QNVGLLSMIIYAILSIRYYNSYRKLIFRELSFADTIQFKWINRYLLVFLLILVFRVALILFFPQWGEFGSKWWYYLLFSGLSYYIALAGYTNFIEAVVPFKLQPFGNEAILDPGPVVANPMPSPVTSSPRIMKEDETSDDSSLQNTPSSEVTEELKLQLQQLMEGQNLYQNPLLSLTDVATELNVTSKAVSLLVNQGFGMNFNDFINHYRVRAIKQRFEEGEHQQRTILSIALDCGFNSKTTFNRVFKKLTGQTPVKYISQLAKK
ncbi:MAG: AraC family transcriptional regulator, partial [Bacteroidota bacterium]